MLVAEVLDQVDEVGMPQNLFTIRSGFRNRNKWQSYFNVRLTICVKFECQIVRWQDLSWVKFASLDRLNSNFV